MNEPSRTAPGQAASPSSGGGRTLRLSCLGDSITRGQLSVDYASLLSRQRPGDLQVTRYGVNGDFAYNLLQRLDAVLAAPADVITVLIGTNDARASLAGYPVETVMRRKDLPTRPAAAWFEDCLVAVLERLRAESDAQLALLSLPALGQDPDGAAVQASQAYSVMIARIAEVHGAAYLPLHERQTAELRRAGAPAIPFRHVTTAAFIGTALQRSVLRRSLDSISRSRGLLLTTDHIHQNSRGAALIAQVIGEAGLY
jgi:lysophospholipase L1-like esterase